MIKEFLEILDKAKELHEKKSADYANPNNKFENFERSALLMEWFNDPIDKAFVNLIGTKLARIATLRNNNKTPNNEPLEDSFFDLTVYCGLWGAYHKRENGRIEIKYQPDSALSFNRISTTITPYKCDYCGVTFSYTPTIINALIYCSDQCAGKIIDRKKP